MLLYFFYPVFNIIQGLFVANIVYKHNPVAALIVVLSNFVEMFLSGGIPHLDVQCFSIQRHFFSLKIHTHCGYQCRTESVQSPPVDETAFTHTTVTQHKDFHTTHWWVHPNRSRSTRGCGPVLFFYHCGATLILLFLHLVWISSLCHLFKTFFQGHDFTLLQRASPLR